jgi:serine/threonine protein kinase
MENALTATEHQILGTEQYSAPEYFLGEGGTTQSDLFSLGVITYQMLSGKLPYGTHVPRARTRAAQRKLRYLSVMDDDREIPLWVDEAIKKSVHPNPYQRYQELSEFIFDLRHPNKAFLNRSRPPLLERNPVLFWKGISLILAMIIIVMVVNQQAG